MAPVAKSFHDKVPQLVEAEAGRPAEGKADRPAEEEESPVGDVNLAEQQGKECFTLCSYSCKSIR